VGHVDPVTPHLRATVLDRDRRCVAILLDPGAGFCHDMWGNMRSPYDRKNLTLDHVQEDYGRMGKRAPSDSKHLVTLCWGHHEGPRAWATSHRPLLREYLSQVE
jgi:hypothetical protein